MRESTFGGRRRPSRPWIATAAAALFLITGVTATLVVGGDRDGAPASSGAAGVPTVVDPQRPATDVTVTLPATPETAPTPVVPAGPVEGSGTPLRACTYTDPGARPINVARARSCPDGTLVWVEGTVVQMADGAAALCDEVAADGATCVGASLRLDVAAAGPTELRGTKQGDSLAVQESRFECASASAPSFVPTVLPAGFAPELVAGSGDPGSNAPPPGPAPGPVFGHFAGGEGRWIDVGELLPLAEPSGSRTLTVLGAPAQLHDVANGRFAVQLSPAGAPCPVLTLVGVGVTQDELIAFAEGLQPAG